LWTLATAIVRATINSRVHSQLISRSPESCTFGTPRCVHTYLHGAHDSA